MRRLPSIGPLLSGFCWGLRNARISACLILRLLVCRAGVYLLMAVADCNVLSAELPPLGGERPRSPFGGIHCMRLGSGGRFALRLLMGFEWSCGKMAGQ